ncbi:MAG TPA: AAA family ATPase [Polyangiaceae bacterium]|jgi:DNA repair protein RecN (Recombination protein N)|nr:AAA family ATPase [Polyangiaceae bacterium]
MLQRLRVRGLALLSDVTLELGSGLNVLTGETGAGKSLLLSALASLLGKPAALGALRRGAEAVCIEAELASGLGDHPALRAVLEVKGMRARASIDGEPRPLSELYALTQSALILTAQGATRELASPAAVLGLLDRRAGSKAALSEFRARRANYLESGAELARLRADLAARGVREQRLSALLEQLEELAPRPGEHAELSRRIELLSRRQQYLEVCARIDDAVCEREHSIESELGQLLSAVRRAPPHSAFEELAAELGQALSALSQVSQRALAIAQELDVDPGELERLETRRDHMERLAARLECASDRLYESASELQAERARLELLEERLAEVEAARERAELAAKDALARLVQQRESAIAALTLSLRRELVSLSLENARLELLLEQRPEPLSHDEPSRLRLGFSANPGQPLLPLERIASGGERSRFVLALACAGATSGRTLVFDEIDQGLGGEALVRLAERLATLARSHQVVCVTHQAALAARADTHFRVHKVTRAGTTITQVKRLDDEARTLELSRMLAGGRAAAGAKALARRLLAEARSAAA